MSSSYDKAYQDALKHFSEMHPSYLKYSVEEMAEAYADMVARWWGISATDAPDYIEQVFGISNSDAPYPSLYDFERIQGEAAKVRDKKLKDQWEELEEMFREPLSEEDKVSDEKFKDPLKELDELLCIEFSEE